MTLLLDRSTQQALLELTRVLIVDDEEPIRRLLGYMLQTHGYETVLASDAREARTRLDEQPFALMLCDVNMPGESGMDLVRDILSQHPHTRHHGDRPRQLGTSERSAGHGRLWVHRQ